MKFVGRGKELATLEAHYATGRFEMAVVYGRRRLGKTSLCRKFAEGKRHLYFTALEKSDAINLRGFSAEVANALDMPGLPAFPTWRDAFAFLAIHAKDGERPLLVVFDEFPYAAKANPTLPSMLQASIDGEMSATGMTLVLCGSNQGFMENEVLGAKSPLYGRRTCQIRVEPFDLAQARLMLPGATAIDAVRYYATLGGTPYYLEQVRADASYRDNVASLMYDPYGLLFREPEMLLRQELNEPATYVSLLDAIAAGATRPNVIADKAGVPQASAGKYLSTMESLGLVTRAVPFGTDPRKSRKGVWKLRDPFLAYWFRFVSPNVAAVEAGAGEAVLDQAASGEQLETYVGGQFEEMCLQWVKRRNASGDLGFLATEFGKWWGADPVAREQADIDVVASDASRSRILLGECKWRESFDETGAISLLEQRGDAVAAAQGAERTYAVFSKKPASPGTRAKAASRGDLVLVSAEQVAEQ